MFAQRFIVGNVKPRNGLILKSVIDPFVISRSDKLDFDFFLGERQFCESMNTFVRIPDVLSLGRIGYFLAVDLPPFPAVKKCISSNF
uniref:AlNc14C126G6814 protein n=1 Tax=Albugo laibachii Nc14 TaxID=890382 RepID=F0WJU4_9STRA|nr:AlNc14C126G6814 [Albugo laibachii Nc14]|eukprot:CCA21546.1 AlNc14C126G6814 [Albugo laibachii Nc14]